MIWSCEEELFVINYYENYPTEEIAEELGRSVQAVRAKARRLGIGKHSHENRLDDDGYITCIHCKRHLLAKEHFVKSDKSKTGFNYSCKFCDTPEQRRSRRLQKKKDDTEKETYTCNQCHEKKLGWHFPWSTSKNRRENYCQVCSSKRTNISKLERIKQGKEW